MDVPTFPRLADHVRARQYLEGDLVRVVLHAHAFEDSVVLPRTTWAVLRWADGTRTLEGIALAAQREGIRPQRDSLVALFTELGRLNLLAEGPPHYGHRVEAAERTTAPDRAIASVPGFRWRCDGRGGCCSMFASVLVTPDECAQIRVAWPDFRSGALSFESMMMPARGSAEHPLAVTSFVDGHCCFREADGRCGIQARAGALAKPRGCRAYPRHYVDDGREVRATVLTECACVLRVPPPGADDIVADTARHVADLDPLDAIDVLPDEVPWTSASSLPREAFRDWLDARWAEPWPADLAVWLQQWADAIEPEREDAVTSAALALAQRCEIQGDREGAWRGTLDPAKRALRWISKGALLLASTSGEAGLEGAALPAEARYLQAAWWGYVDVGRRPWSRWLRGRALRLRVARSMSLVRDETVAEAMYDEPLAIVDGMLRSRGISDDGRL